jgi:hypothetical protein
MLSKKAEDAEEAKVVKKMMNKSVNPFKTETQTTRLNSSAYSQNNSASIKTKPFERCKLYEKIKT